MGKWVKNFESYNKYKKSKAVNEEFIGKLFQGLKDKLSIGFSKMFGNASQADKIMEAYKAEIIEAQAKKREALKAFGEYFKSIQDGGEKDPNKIKELKKNYDVASKNYDEQIKLIKEKFDIKFKEVIDSEENKKIVNYIKLKKIEMQQELLAEENKALLSDGGLKPEDIKDEEFKNMLSEIGKKMEESKKLQESEKAALEKTEEKTLGFDTEKAKEMAKKGETYLWEKSPYKDYKFEKDEELEYFSKKNMEATKANFIEDSDTDTDRIKVKTENSEIEINRGVVISAKNWKPEGDKGEGEDKEEGESES